MIPISETFVSPDLPLEEKVKQLFGVCTELLPGWDALSLKDVEVTPISGGISNMTLKFDPRDAPLPPVAVKLFGDKTEVLVDRERERASLQALNKAGFGAKVLGFYHNGRIEEFLFAKTLAPPEMSSPIYLPRIAATLQRFHQTRLPSTPPDTTPPDSLFPTIRSWLRIVRSLSFPDPAKQAAFSALDLDTMAKEIGEIADLCAAVNSPVVFSHNDLLSGNILIIQPGGQEAGGEADANGPLQFIDFEYSDYCCRGFDFGNHFNEFAGFDCDWSLYPSEATQKLFFTSYLEAAGEGVTEGVLEDMMAEANLYSLSSHMYWGVWSLVQARYSAIEFDYLEYSQMRWAQYYKTKEAFVETAKLRFGVKEPVLA